MQKQIKDIHDYYDVITGIWHYFRKFYTNYNADLALKEYQDFADKLKFKGPRLYDFGMNLIRIVYKEVGELHEMRKENEEDKS